MQRRRGFTLIELLVVVAIIAVLLAIAIPIAKTAKLNATETVVAREMQTIHQAQMQYSSQFGVYAASLRELGPPAQGDPGPNAAKLIPRSLSSGEKDGYVFTLSKTPGGYTANAAPKIYGDTGRRTFYIDEDGTVHQNWGRTPAAADSPEFR